MIIIEWPRYFEILFKYSINLFDEQVTPDMRIIIYTSDLGLLHPQSPRTQDANENTRSGIHYATYYKAKAKKHVHKSIFYPKTKTMAAIFNYVFGGFVDGDVYEFDTSCLR